MVVVGCQKVRSECQRQFKINQVREVCVCVCVCVCMCVCLGGEALRQGGRGNCMGRSPVAGVRELGSFKVMKICGWQSKERDH